MDGLWSYSLDEVEKGLQTSYAGLAADYRSKFGETLTEIDAMGISAMMHGYLAFDKNNKLLVPFRTWRNTNTEKAADELTELFRFNMPMRWSVSQYYQAILDGEEHVKNVKFLTTLAGYIHYKLTGRKVLGVGDASGMFPINGKDFDRDMLDKFNTLLAERGIEIPVFGMIKDGSHKTRVLTDGEHEIQIVKDRALFTLVYRIQEEAHRFAISRMSEAKRKTIRRSPLESLPGIGPAKSAALYAAFGSLKRMREAERESIALVKGITEENARVVWEYLTEKTRKKDGES
jgi:hypothetical protein